LAGGFVFLPGNPEGGFRAFEIRLRGGPSPDQTIVPIKFRSGICQLRLGRADLGFQALNLFGSFARFQSAQSSTSLV